MERTVIVTCTLSDDEALALAQFLKRMGLDDYRKLSIDSDEAWTMLDAGERLRAALAAAGYTPR